MELMKFQINHIYIYKKEYFKFVLLPFSLYKFSVSSISSGLPHRVFDLSLDIYMKVFFFAN